MATRIPFKTLDPTSIWRLNMPAIGFLYIAGVIVLLKSISFIMYPQYTSAIDARISMLFLDAVWVLVVLWQYSVLFGVTSTQWSTTFCFGIGTMAIIGTTIAFKYYVKKVQQEENQRK